MENTGSFMVAPIIQNVDLRTTYKKSEWDLVVKFRLMAHGVYLQIIDTVDTKTEGAIIASFPVEHDHTKERNRK